MGVFFFLIPVEITWALQQYDIELKGILKTQQIFTKAITFTHLRVAS